MKPPAAFLLLALAVPAAAGPFVLRPEMPISEPEYSAGPRISRGDAHIATDGDGYLAVWTDHRSSGEPAVYAARLGADGTVIDRLGLRVVDGGHAGGVVWTGSKYLILYEKEPASRAYVRTMTPEAVFGEPIEVGEHARFGGMATNGTNVLLLVGREARMLDLEGNALRSVPLAGVEGGYYHPAVAAAGGAYLVATAQPHVTIQVVSSDGTVAPPRTLGQRERYGRVGLATDGERFLVVWPQKQLAAQLVTRDGVPEGPVHTLTAGASSDYPSLVWRGGEYFLVYSETDEFAHYAMRVAADGRPAGEPKRLGRGTETDVAMAARGGEGIALFERMKAALFDDASLAANEPFRRIVDVAITARPQWNVHLARLGEGYVAAWEEEGGIFVSRSAGMTPVAVLGSGESLIDVLVDRSEVIWVLWGDQSSVAVSRFTPMLQPIDPQPNQFHTPGVVYRRAAAGDGVIALAYEVDDDDHPDPNALDVAALLLRETGTGIERRDILLTTELFADHTVAVAFDGAAFVYGWAHAKGNYPPFPSTRPMPEHEIVAARVAPNGDLLDAMPVRVAGDVGPVWNVQAARGANGAAFAWQSATNIGAALFHGPVRDFGGQMPSLGAFAPHEDGFLLVRGDPRSAPQLTHVEYLVLGADLSPGAAGTLPPYEADTFWSPFDIDAIGGASPVFAYGKSANGGRYGHVSRVFVRRTGEAPARRRALR